MPSCILPLKFVVPVAHFSIAGFFKAMELSFQSRINLPEEAQHPSRASLNWERAMLSWVVTFLVIALIAGLLGFGGIAGASIEIAKIVFFVAIVLFLISAVIGLARGRRGSI